MTVIIVHGTHDQEGTWWIETKQGDFAAQVDLGLQEAGAQPQVWRIGDAHVSEFDELQPRGNWHWLRGRTDPPFYNRDGRFRWSGLDLHGPGRRLGGRQLARYLEQLSKLVVEEDVHVIAHSHGCNIVKQATCELASPVRLGRVVFLACPHFTDVHGGELPYRVNKDVLGHYRRPVLNLFSPEDMVQTSIAEIMPDLGMAPGMPKIEALGFEGTPLVEAYRSDQDPTSQDVYEEFAVTYSGGSGIAAHSAVHTPKIGRFLGYWIGQGADVSARSVWDERGLGDCVV
jgi:hypothetical protein